MKTLRQSSTTSLAKYAHISSLDLNNRSFDFCNSFWGPSDVGYEVLLTRMKGGERTMGELRAFWKERAAIEDDYAKRLNKLAKHTLGRYEIGELRNSLDTLLLETDKQATMHVELGQKLRNELEGPATAFIAKQSLFTKTYQSAIEKAFKTKRVHESHVNRAHEKYETDCLRINTFSAQSKLVQGKELEKLTLKLERTKQTVSANEADFSKYSRQLTDTLVKWEKDWKGFCDGCQDLEEERIEFMKDNVWRYADAISTVCVSDAESCEDIRVALDHLEPERDIENFVRKYDTGNQIPDPPQLTGSMPQHGTEQKSTLTVRYAHFQRSSQRTNLMQQLLQQHDPGQEYEPVDAGEAGIGAGGRGRVGSSGSVVSEPDGTSRSGAQSRPNSRGPDITALVNRNGVQHAPSSSKLRSAFKPHLDPHAEPIDPTHQQMLLVGESAFKVDPSKDPQTTSEPGPGLVSAPLISQFYMQKDYRSSAEILVGPSPDPVGPISPAKSRCSSSPPTASFMRPPLSGPSSTDAVMEVIGNYGQSFPYERSASNLFSRNSPGASSGRNSDVESRNGAGHASSVSGSNFLAGSQSQDDGSLFAERLSHSGSREEYPGFGTSLRSLGPQLPANNVFLNPYSPISGPSPAPNSSPSAGQPNGSVGSRPGFTSASPVPGPGAEEVNVVRVSSLFGIVSDASGRVMRDVLADHYTSQHPRQRRQSPHQSQLHRPPGSGSSPNYPHSTQRSTSAVYPELTNQQPHQEAYGSQLPPSNVYNLSQRPIHQPNNGGGYASLQRSSSVGYHDQPIRQHPPPQSHSGYQHSHQPHNAPEAQDMGYALNEYGGGDVTGYRNPSPGVLPSNYQEGVLSLTGEYAGDEKTVLFYVKALYPYQATTDEEFDFQVGDIIAVTSTPEDGWWTGSLLDDSRRVHGRTVFPSNFVCLF